MDIVVARQAVVLGAQIDALNALLAQANTGEVIKGLISLVRVHCPDGSYIEMDFSSAIQVTSDETVTIMQTLVGILQNRLADLTSQLKAL